MVRHAATCRELAERLVIVAHNSLTLEAIRIGFRQSGEFNLVGRADTRRTSAQTIVGTDPEIVLLDDMDRSEQAVELVRDIKLEDERLALIALSLQMDRPGSSAYSRRCDQR